VVIMVSSKVSSRSREKVLGGLRIGRIFFTEIGGNLGYYLFFSVIEIATTVLIVWFAWNWPESVAQVELTEPELSASRR
jgi:hypothetical protein